MRDGDPVASTSTLPPTTTGRKTCDACALRKVACKRTSTTTDACQACIKQGIVCVTTPKARKAYPANRKSGGGSRIEKARETFGAVAGSTSSTPPNNSPPLSNRQISFKGTDHRLLEVHLEGALSVELLQLFEQLPQTYLNLFSLQLLMAQFEHAGRSLHRLSPSSKMLAATVMAISSYSSSNPLLFSFGPPAPSLAVNEALSHEFDLRAFGYRRAQTCKHLTDRAISFATENGSLFYEGNKENIASGYLLGTLLYWTSPVAGKRYAGASATLLREALYDPVMRITYIPSNRDDREIPWVWMLMLDAFTSLHGRTFTTYTEQDLRAIMRNETPSVAACTLSLQALISQSTIPLDSMPEIGHLVDYFIVHLTDLARFCLEKVIGPSTHPLRLDASKVSHFLQSRATVVPFYNILLSFGESIIAPDAVLSISGQEEVTAIAANYHIIKLCMSTIALPIYLEFVKTKPSFSFVSSPPAFGFYLAEQELDLGSQLKILAIQGAISISELIEDTRSLAFWTHLIPMSQLMIGSTDVVIAEGEDGGIMGREQRWKVLNNFLRGIKSLGWSWASDEGQHSWTWTLADRIQDTLRQEGYVNCC